MAAPRFPQTNSQMPRGRSLLRDPRYNRGTAFTLEEREVLGLKGLLPPAVLSLVQQCERAYEQYQAQPTDLARNSFLAALHDRNEVLYYKLLEDHLKEMLPVVYDPVVAQAIERYSHQFQRPNGVYLSVDDVDGVVAAAGGRHAYAGSAGRPPGSCWSRAPARGSRRDPRIREAGGTNRAVSALQEGSVIN